MKPVSKDGRVHSVAEGSQAACPRSASSLPKISIQPIIYNSPMVSNCLMIISLLIC